MFLASDADPLNTVVEAAYEAVSAYDEVISFVTSTDEEIAYEAVIAYDAVAGTFRACDAVKAYDAEVEVSAYDDDTSCLISTEDDIA